MDANEPHKVLGVAPNASMAEIKQAYRQMALKWHPDKHTQDADKQHAINTFSEVTNAYQILIRDIAPPSSTPRSKIRARLPTPVPSVKASSIDSPTTSSTSSHSQFSALHHSRDSSQTTLPSSPTGSHVFPTPPRDIPRPTGIPVFILPKPGDRSALQPESEYRSKALPDSHQFRPTPLRFSTPEPASRNRNINVRDHEGPKPSAPIPIPFPIHHLSRDGDPQLLQPGPPLHSLGVGASGEWIYSLTLTLEELFTGKNCHFCIVRNLLSGHTKNVIIEIDVPSGCQRGTRILCRGVGHELPHGQHQDIAFIIEEANHGRFTRLQNDLFMDVQLPWSNTLVQRPQRLCIKGIDDDDIVVFIDYPRDKLLKGELSVRGAGMPIWKAGRVCGKGNLIVRWEIQPPQTRVWRFIGRIFHPRSKRTPVSHQS